MSVEKTKTPAPFGSWASPLTAQRLTAKSLRFSEVIVEGGDVFWLEARPEEGGRSIIVRRAPDGTLTDVTPEGFGVRTLVNSYGGGSYAVSGDEVIFSAYRPTGAPAPFDKHRDQRLFSQSGSKAPTPLTDAVGSFWADGCFDQKRNRLIVVREDQSHLLNTQPLQTLSAIDLSGKSAPAVLAMGADFYAYPRLSPDGKQLAWISWNYPDMAWDSAELWLADVGADGALTNKRAIAGGPNEAAMQPVWSKDGWLCFAGDRSGWWNLYRWDGEVAHCLHSRAAEFSEPLWSLGSSRYGFLSDGKIACAYREAGRWNLGVLDPANGDLTEIPSPYTEINSVKTGDDFVVFGGSGPDVPTALVRYDVSTGHLSVMRSATDLPLDELQPWLSRPEPISFPTRDGGEAHAFYYAPKNPDFCGENSKQPPLIVRSHGGPTGWASTGLQMAIQYFTSRGFAVVDVDYRGSAGYGRDYRLSLYGHWGERDIFDCADAADYLIEKGVVDGTRVVATGGSAGGYITLGLVAFTDLLKAGVSYYGISSLEMIVQHSDKLEAFYPFKLIGPWPEAADLYRERSPLHRVEEVTCPVCFFQGLEDPVVPPAQTRVMVDSLKERGIPVAAVYFEGEQHGFRKAENIQRSLENELSFYAQVLDFEPAGTIAALDIDGLG